jgi:hypothetical protein
MSNASRDENNRTTLIGISQDDGSTIIPIVANPVNNGICVDDNTTGSDNGNNGGIAYLDENSVPVFLAESSDGSGDLVEVYATSDGKLLVNSN